MNARTSSTSRFNKIGEIARLINTGGDLNTILSRIVYAICSHSNWTSCGIVRIDSKTGYSVLAQRFDPQAPDAKKSATRWALASSPAAKVAATGEMLIIPDAQRSSEFPGYKKDALLRDYHTVVILPLDACDSAGREMILAVQSKDVVKVSRPELAFLKTVSDLAAIAVEKALRLQQERAANTKLRKTTALHAQLMEEILRKGSLAAVCEILEKSLRHPWLVIDLTTRAIYAGGGSPLRDIPGKQWRELVRGRASRHIFDAARHARRAQFREPASLEFEFDAGKKSVTLSAFIEPLQVDGETMGALLLAPGKSAFDAFDRLTAETVLLALSVQLMRGYLHFQTEATSRADVLSRLFSGDWRSTQGFMARALDLGIDTSIPARLVGFGFLDADQTRVDFTMGYAHRYISGLTAKFFADAVTVQHDNDIIALLPVDEKRGAAWDKLKQRLPDDAEWALGARQLCFAAECARYRKIIRRPAANALAC